MEAVPIIHNRIVSYPGGDFGGTNAPTFRMIGPESLKLGSWGADALDELEALANEPVLIRNRMSSFNGTRVDGRGRGYLERGSNLSAGEDNGDSESSQCYSRKRRPQNRRRIGADVFLSDPVGAAAVTPPLR